MTLTLFIGYKSPELMKHESSRIKKEVNIFDKFTVVFYQIEYMFSPKTHKDTEKPHGFTAAHGHEMVKKTSSGWLIKCLLLISTLILKLQKSIRSAKLEWTRNGQQKSNQPSINSLIKWKLKFYAMHSNAQNGHFEEIFWFQCPTSIVRIQFAQKYLWADNTSNLR